MKEFQFLIILGVVLDLFLFREDWSLDARILVYELSGLLTFVGVIERGYA